MSEREAGVRADLDEIVQGLCLGMLRGLDSMLQVMWRY